MRDGNPRIGNDIAGPMFLFLCLGHIHMLSSDPFLFYCSAQRRNGGVKAGELGACMPDEWQCGAAVSENGGPTMRIADAPLSVLIPFFGNHSWLS
jgi:hypothetical protein